MKIQNRTIAGTTILSVEGRLDTAFSLTLERKMDSLIHVGENKFVINLSKTDYLASSGIRVLIAFAKRLADSGGMVLLSSPHPKLEPLFETAQLSRVIPVHDNDGDAVIALTRSVPCRSRSTPSNTQSHVHDAVEMEEEERRWNRQMEAHHEEIQTLTQERDKHWAIANARRKSGIDNPFVIALMFVILFPLLAIAFGLLSIWLLNSFFAGCFLVYAGLVLTLYLIPWAQRSAARIEAKKREEAIAEKERAFEETLRRRVHEMMQE